MKMSAERIKEMQDKTAYPDSISVQQALFQVWNKVAREILEEFDACSNSKPVTPTQGKEE